MGHRAIVSSQRPMPTANCQPCVPRFGKSLRRTLRGSASGDRQLRFCRISDSESAITWLFSHPSGSDTARCPLVRPRGRCAASGCTLVGVIWANSSSVPPKTKSDSSSRRNVDPTENPLRYKAACFPEVPATFVFAIEFSQRSACRRMTTTTPARFRSRAIGSPRIACAN